LQLHDAQTKLNDNFKLMAEMSDENVRLAAEKMRVERMLDEAKVQLGHPRQRRLPQVEDAVNVRVASPANHRDRGLAQQSQRSHGRARHMRRPRYPREEEDLGEAKAGADVSSPDLGVDVSSDPLSSLERGRRQQQQHQQPSDPQPAPFAEGQSRQRLVIPIGGSLPPAIKSYEPASTSMAAENRQLRQERDLLMQKLIRSKGALKETLDKLGANSGNSSGAESETGSGRRSLSSLHKTATEAQQALAAAQAAAARHNKDLRVGRDPAGLARDYNEVQMRRAARERERAGRRRAEEDEGPATEV